MIIFESSGVDLEATDGISPTKPKRLGGIGEAIHQYENNAEPNTPTYTTVNAPLSVTSTHRESRAIARVKKALGTNILNNSTLRPTSFSHLQDDIFHSSSYHQRSHYLDVTKHTATYSTPLEIPKLSRSIEDDVTSGEVR